MAYDPEKYWHERGFNYQAPGEEAEKPEVENLKAIVADRNLRMANILEVGSGYGRIYLEIAPLLQEGYSRFDMCDFVESMRYKCLRNTGKLPDYWDGLELPYNDAEFDLVISFSVMLHVRPDAIEKVIAEHARVTKECLFIATYAGGLERLAEHCFEHPYEAIYEKLGLMIEDKKTFQGGLRANWLLSK